MSVKENTDKQNLKSRQNRNNNTGSMASTYFTRTKKLIRSNTTREPFSRTTNNIQDNIKYSNATLFELREEQMREKELIRNATLKNLNKSKPSSGKIPNTQKELPKLKFNYITENPYNPYNRMVKNKSEAKIKLFDGLPVKSTGPNVNFLRELEKERKEYKNQRDFANEIKNFKRKEELVNMGIQCKNPSEYIAKTREILLVKYLNDIKKERAVRIKENITNEIESIDDTIRSMKDSKKLFSDEFFHKFSDYVKYLSLQKEREKAIDTSLMECIIKLNKEKETINIKIEKAKAEKESSIRWMFFQIQLMEKKITLPKYYMTVLDNNLFKPDMSENEIKNALLNCNNSSITNNLKGINAKEIKRLLEYKKGTVYKTPQEFIDAFKHLDDLNIKNLELLNNNNEIIFRAKEEKIHFERDKTFQNENKKKEEIGLYLILQGLKEKNNQLIKQKERTIRRINQDESKFSHSKEKKRPKSTNHYYAKKNKKAKYQKNELYKKVYSLFCNCCCFKENGDEIIQEVKKKTHFLSLETEMLNCLTVAEGLIDKILRNNELLIKQFSKQNEYKSVQHYIERQHKIAKARQQMKEEKYKLDLLQEKIYKKATKVYFLPNKKVETYYGLFVKKNNNIKEVKKEHEELEFEDFMYDLTD